MVITFFSISKYEDSQWTLLLGSVTDCSLFIKWTKTNRKQLLSLEEKCIRMKKTCHTHTAVA